MLADWTNDGFDPFAAPRDRVAVRREGQGRRHPHAGHGERMVGVPGDEPLRSDDTGHPVNRMFADVAQDEPTVEAEPGYEQDVAAFNLFAYLSRSDVTWNPSVVSVCRCWPAPPDHRGVHPADHPRQRPGRVGSCSCPTSSTGRSRTARRATLGQRGDEGGRRGDAMPADIRHQGYSPKRAMLLVWENGSPALPDLIAQGKAPKTAVEF